MSTVQKALEERKSRKKKKEESTENKKKNTQEKVDVASALKARESRIKRNLQSTTNDIVTRVNAEIEAFKKLSDPTWGGGDDAFKSSLESTRQNRLNVSSLIRDVEAQRKYLGDENADAMLESLKTMKSGYDSHLSATETRSKYKSEDEYKQKEKEAIKAQEDYDALVNFDLNKGKAEIDDILSGDEMTALKTEKQNLNNSIRLYNRGDRSTYKTYDEVKAAKDRMSQIDKEIEELEKQANQKKVYYNQAKHTQEGVKLTNDALESEDYHKYNLSNEEFGEDKTYKYINNINNFRTTEDAYWLEHMTTTTNEGVVLPTILPEYLDSNYELMTEDEIGIYNYYYSKFGKEKANEYLDNLQQTLNTRKATQFREDADNDFERIMFGIAAGLDQFSSGMENLFNTSDDYITPSEYQIASGMIREDLADSGFKIGGTSIGQIGYDLTNTTANMLPSILTSTAIGFINPVAGQVVGAGLMGASASGNAYAEMLNLGYEKGQARLYSGLVGASEATLQYLLGGIGKLGGGKFTTEALVKVANNMDNAFARVAIKLGGNALGEFSEEYLQEVLNPLFKNITLGTDEEVKLFSTEALYSGILGALSAGILEGGSTIASDVKTTKLGKNVQNIDGGVARLKKLGTTFSADSVAYQIADKVTVETGAYKIGLLLQEAGATLSEQNVSDITIELTKKGLTESAAKKIAKSYQAFLNGEMSLTNEQVEVLEGLDPLKDVLKKSIIGVDTSIYQRTREYSDLVNLATEAEVATSSAPQTEVEKSPQPTALYSNEYIDTVAKEFESIGMPTEMARDMAVAQLSKGKGSDSTPTEGKSSPAEENSVENEFEVSADGKTINRKTDKIVNIKKIESISGDGEANLTTDDGMVVKASDLAFGSEAEAVFISNIGKMKVGKNPISTSSANALYMTAMKALEKNPNMTAVEAVSLVKGLEESYIYGTYNFGRSKLTTRNADGSARLFAGEISQEHRAFAYNLGVGDSIVKAANKQKVIDKLKEKANENASSETTAKKGSVRFEQGVVARGKLQKRAVSLAKHLASAIGIDIVFYDAMTTTNIDGEKSNGYFDPETDTIYLDLQNSWEDAKTIVYTMSHELVHFIKKWSPEKFDIFAKFLMEQYGKHGVDSAQLLANKMVELETDDADFAYEEMICDACETMLLDSDAVYKLMELRKTDLELFDKIKLHIHELLNKIRNMYKKLGLKPTSDEAKALLEMKDVLEQIYSLFEEAAVDAAQSYQAIQNSNETVFGEKSVDVGQTESGVKNQLKNHKKIGEDAVTYNNRHKNVHEAILKVGVESMYEMAETMLPYLEEEGILPPDIPGKTIFKNGSYGRTGENTTLCVRTLTYEDFKDRVAEELGRPLTVSESLLVSQKIYDIATEPQCIYCYVAADRKAYDGYLGEYWKAMDKYIKAMRNGGDSQALYTEYLAGRKDTNQQKKRWSQWEAIAKSGKEYISAKDLTTKRKRDALIAKKNAFSEQIKDAQRYAQSASWAKTVFDYRAYKGDILKMTSKFVDMLNSEYGLRMYSFSDYTPAFIVENMQMIIDASVKGLKSLAYTKDTDYAEIFASTGQAINVSCFAKWDAEFGTYVEDNRQGANWEKTKNLRKQYRNVGAVMVATNDAMVEWALKQDWVDVVIPYHIVKTGTTIANEYQWNNYTSESADRIGNKTANIYPTEHNNDFATYSNLLNERGITPRFSKWYDMVASGKLTENQYMKLVNEVRLPASELSAVVPSFNLEAAKKSFGIDNDGNVIKGGFVDKGGYMGGWYRQGIDVNQEVMAVSEDIKAGKSSLDVDYGMSKAAKEKAEARYKKQAKPSKKNPEQLDPRTVTREDVEELLNNVNLGAYDDNTYIPLRISTPSVLIYWAKKKLDDVIDNNPIAMSAGKAYQAMAQRRLGDEARPHKLSVPDMISIIEEMNNPRYIVYQESNGRYVEVIENVTEDGKKVFAILEIGEFKDSPYMNGYESDIYNVLVTAFSPDAGKLRELLKNPKNKVIFDKEKDLSQGTSSSMVPSVLNDKPFYEEIIPQDTAESQEKTVKKQIKKSSSSYAPTFYSQMGKVIEGVKQEKLAANSVVNLLRGKGVKAEEIRWSGIVPFLEGKKSITKQELLDFINGSMLQIDEEMSGAKYLDAAGKRIHSEESFREAAYLIADEKGIDRNEVEFMLDGGDIYAYAGTLSHGELLYAEGIGGARWSEYKLDGGSNYREIVFTLPNNSYSNRMMRVHWGEDAEGVLVHARIQDFDVNGKKMLFIEEIQSDWHNEGHKEGYESNISAEDREEFDKLEKTIDSLNEQYEVINKEKGTLDIDYFKGEKMSFEEYSNKSAALIEKSDEIVDKLNYSVAKREELYSKFKNAAPDAPFKENYHEYVIKRLLRMAAENGYDSIGWTPSEIQSDRWSDEYAEAYRIEYDQEMPKFLKKYGRQWGAKVEKTNVGAFEQQIDVDTQTPLNDDAWLLADGISSEGTEVWSMDITDSMKESVLYEGQVMFQKKKTSNRTILANALEGAVKDDIEKNKLAEYKEKISLIETEEQRLSEIQKQLFTKGAVEPENRKELQFEAKQIANRINTYDRQLLNLESTTALKNVLNREKQLAAKRQKQKDNEALKQYKEKVAKNTRELLTRNQESRKKAIESREKTAIRHKIKNVVNDLNNLLLKPTKERHVPEEMRIAVAEALDLVNMDTVAADERVAKYNELIAKAKDPDVIASLTETRDRILNQGTKLADKLAKLKDAYGMVRDSADDSLKSMYDDVIYNKIEYVQKSVGKTPLRNMTLAQLEGVYDLYKMVLTTVRDSNKAFAENLKMSRLALGSNTFEEIKKNNKSRDRIKHESVERFLWQNLKPMQAMKKIGSETLQTLWNNILYGQEVFAQDYDEAVKFAKEMKDKYGYNKWELDKLYSFESKSGKTFKINLEQMMSIYAYSKRHQADEHIELGGIVLNEVLVKEKELFGKPTKHIGKTVKYKVNDSTAYRLNKNQVDEIIATLEEKAPGAKDFVDEMQAYLSDVMGEKGNEVAMKMYGVKLFKEEHYFPLKSSKDFMEAANAKLKGDVKIKNKGMTKSTVEHARNPIVLENFLDVWGNHINEMSMYHGLVLPLEDFTRTLNYSYKADETLNTDAESVRTALHDAFGESADNYLNELLKAINGGVLHDSSAQFADKMISKFKKAKVMASLSVIVQQPTAIIRAMGIIEPKYFVAQNFHHKATWEELKKYCPTAIIKETGSFDTNMGRTIVDMIKDERGITDKVGDVLGKAPAYMDEMGWNMIWRALKKKVATEQKLSGEDLLKECGKQMTLILNETQVYDSVLSRNELMRSKSLFNKMATSFMAEPATVSNMIYGAALDFKRGKKGTAAKTVTAVITSVVINGLVSSMVYALRDDDEEKTLLEKYLSSATSEVLDGLNPLTYIPYVKDAWSIFQGYKVERTDMALIKDMYDAVDTFYNVLDPEAYEEGMSRKDIAKHIFDNSVPMLTSICDMFGLPVGNILRDAEAIIVNDNVPMAQASYAGTKDALKEGLLGTLPKIAQKIIGTDTKQDKLYDAIINGDFVYIKRLKSTYKDDKAYETAVRKALRENDTRIKEAAEARINGNIAEYTRIVKRIKAEGKFSQDTIVASINAEINAINKGESSTTSSTEDKASSIYKMDDYYASIVGGDEASAYVVKEDIINTDVENGKDRDEAEDNFNSRFSSYVREQYEDGYISEDEAEDMLVDYGDKSKDDAASKVQYWSFKQDYPDYDDLSEEAVGKYYDEVEPHGISIDVYNDYSKQRSKCKGVDANGDGKTDSGSKKAEILKVINSLPISRSQKDVLYYLNGWSSKTLHEAPWR